MGRSLADLGWWLRIFALPAVWLQLGQLRPGGSALWGLGDWGLTGSLEDDIGGSEQGPEGSYPGEE